jgi:hypothetical protein
MAAFGAFGHQVRRPALRLLSARARQQRVTPAVGPALEAAVELIDDGQRRSGLRS